MRLVRELQRAARLRQIDGKQVVRIGRHYVHRVVDDERLPFVSVRDAGAERGDDVEVLNVGRVDRVERAVAEVAVVAGRHPPFGVRQIGNQVRGRRRAGDAALRRPSRASCFRFLATADS